MTSSPNPILQRIHVPAGRGCAFKAARGQVIAVVDPAGGQCVDFWAIDARDYDHYSSPPHTIAHIQSLQPRVGDQFVTNRRQPIFTVLADDVGWHDLLYPPCDPLRYLLYFGVKEHRSCQQNFLEATAEFGWGGRPVPFPPFNIFMNTTVGEDGRVITGEPRSRPGDMIVLRAEMDLLCVASSCPMDLTPTGGSGVTDVDILIASDLRAFEQALI